MLQIDDGVTGDSVILGMLHGRLEVLRIHALFLDKVLHGSLDLTGLDLAVFVAMAVEAGTEGLHLLDPGRLLVLLDLDAGDGEGEEGRDE